MKILREKIFFLHCELVQGLMISACFPSTFISALLLESNLMCVMQLVSGIQKATHNALYRRGLDVSAETLSVIVCWGVI